MPLSEIHGFARLDVDEATEAALDVIGARRLVDFHRLHQSGLEAVKADCAGFRVRVAPAVVASRSNVGRRNTPADGRCHELGSETANADKRAFAALAVDGDAADPLQGFSQVLIRKRADVLGGDRVDKVVGVSLAFQRLLHAAADAGHDDLFDDASLFFVRVGLLGRRCAAEQHGGKRRGDQPQRIL